MAKRLARVECPGDRQNSTGDRRIMTTRWNIEEDGDDLIVCRGFHQSSEGCENVRYVRSRSLEEAKRLLREVLRCIPTNPPWHEKNCDAASSNGECTCGAAAISTLHSRITQFIDQ
jgi:hypothetical protein